MNNKESLLSFSSLFSFLCYKSRKPRNSLLVAFCSLLILVCFGIANAQEDLAVEQEKLTIEQEELTVEQEDLAVEQEKLTIEQESGIVEQEDLTMESLSPQSQPSDLKSDVPGLCYECHVKLKDSLSNSYVHFPFEDGRCISCHNAHASNMKGLTREDTNSLCLSCHDAIGRLLKQDYIHYALKKGVCTDCHYAHSGNNPALLVRTKEEICWNCHESLKGQLNNSFVHGPFAEGKCSSCHDPHASSEEDQIREASNALCQECHAPGCKAGDVSITFVTENMNCTSCHGGHASSKSGLLGPYGHTAFLNKTCEQCHNPILPETAITTTKAGSALCFQCHKKDPKKFRENDVHGSDEQGGCGMCHSYHASKKKDLTIKESGRCYKCHEKVEKSTALMEKALRSIECVPVKDRKCFDCHVPLYFREGSIQTCARCHTLEHEVAHPMGQDALDPRDGQPMTCITCHSMHASKAEMMLIYDAKRQLCIQCHKK
jgi:predicted CXXCH cytochrome family protein